jgi:hypothetical protein
VVAGQVTIVYAIGSLEEQTLGAVVQTITVGESGAAPAPGPAPAPVPVPSGVPAGDSGLAADAESSFPAGVALAIVGLAGLGMTVAARSLIAARAKS